MIYQPVIDLRIKHTYYPDGQCPDFAPVPNAATQQLLAGHRCLIRQSADGLQISTALGTDQKPFVPLLSGTRLVFELRLTNDEFRLFTDLQALAGNAAPVFTTDGAPSASPLVLALAARTASRREALVFPAKASQADFALGGTPLRGLTIAKYVVDGLGGADVAALANNGRQVTITAPDNPSPCPFSVTYPVQPSLAEGVFAEVEIEVGPGAAAGTQSDYEIHFTTLSARWRYYVVAASSARYSIDFGQQATFVSAPADAGDLVAQSLQQQYGGTSGININCLTSQTALPCRPAAPQGLTLKSAAQGAEPEPLAPPPLQNLCLVSGAPAFFQIVRKTVNS